MQTKAQEKAKLKVNEMMMDLKEEYKGLGTKLFVARGYDKIIIEVENSWEKIFTKLFYAGYINDKFYTECYIDNEDESIDKTENWNEKEWKCAIEKYLVSCEFYYFELDQTYEEKDERKSAINVKISKDRINNLFMYICKEIKYDSIPYYYCINILEFLNIKPYYDIYCYEVELTDIEMPAKTVLEFFKFIHNETREGFLPHTICINILKKMGLDSNYNEFKGV